MDDFILYFSDLSLILDDFIFDLSDFPLCLKEFRLNSDFWFAFEDFLFDF